MRRKEQEITSPGMRMNYFDCHADTLTEIKEQEESLLENRRDLDLKRVHGFAGRYTQIFALWKDWKTMDRESPEKEFNRLYNRALSLLRKAGSEVLWCRNADDMRKAHAQGKAAVFLSLEDMAILGDMAEKVRELGIRFAMLTWNYENRYACGAVFGQERGLTPEGKLLVRSLLKQEIVLDISHLSDRGAEDIFSLTDRPVMASHSDVRRICSNPRNLNQEQIKEIIRRKGIIGINFFAPFVGEKPSLSDLVRHMDAILEAGGEDILAVGSDFDGCDGLFPEGIQGVQSIPHIKEILTKEGFSEKLLEKIFFGNADRFVAENVR